MTKNATSHAHKFSNTNANANATILSRAMVLSLGLTLPVLLAAACSNKPTGGDGAIRHKALVARGAALVSIGGCHDCHTPMKFDAEIGMPIPDMGRMLSGHPEGAPAPSSHLSGHDTAAIGPTFTSFRLPFGVVYTANLTPDKATGLGNWTAEMFVKAVRTGRHMGGAGRPILPPMPWQNLAPQSDDDLKAIFAYLGTVPAIKNDVPAPEVPEQAMNAIAAAYDKMAARMEAADKSTGEHAQAPAPAQAPLAQR